MLFASKVATSYYFLAFTVSLLGSLGLTYLVRERAKRARLFDPSDARKVHSGEIPRIGGVAIYLSVLVASVVLYAAFGVPDWVDSRLLVVLAGATGMHFLGLWDDVRPIRARWKFAAQVIIAVCVYAAGLRVTAFSLPLAGSVHLAPLIGFTFTVAWLVGVTNAFNLIDGLDGLASGAALFALTTMFVVAGLNGQVGAAVVTLAIAGATMGFLFYNFNPASIFLGDSGSLFLGFSLAAIGLLSSQKSSTAVAVAIPVVSLGLPVLDTTLAIVRRFLRGQPIFAPDRGHIHHRLLGLGHSPRRVALILYGICALFALGAMLLVTDSKYVALVLLVVGLGVGIIVQRLRFYEFSELARIVRRGAQQRTAIGRGVRIREASARVDALEDLDRIFQALERTFAADDFRRAEVRLRAGFLNAEAGAHERRADDDSVVWSWSRDAAVSPHWWEIRLPLLQPDGARIGCLVLWQELHGSDASLSHVQTIAAELRGAIERKLIELWHRPIDLVQAAPPGPDAVEPTRPRGTAPPRSRSVSTPAAVDAVLARSPSSDVPRVIG